MVMKKPAPILAAFCFLAALHGCGPSLREQALIEFDNQLKSIKTIGIVPPDVLIYELGTGGMKELIDEWCEQGQKNFLNIIRKELHAKSVAAEPVPADSETRGEMEDIIYLFRAVSDSLEWRTTYKRLADCVDIQACRDYSVGAVERLLRKSNVDAFLLVFAYNEIETKGRRGARRASRAMSIFTPFNPVRNPGMFVSMALIDRSGAVLWYSGAMSGKGYDLRDEKKAEEVSKRLLRRLLGEDEG